MAPSKYSRCTSITIRARFIGDPQSSGEGGLALAVYLEQRRWARSLAADLIDTVPRETRRLVLRGSDGIVFVADSMAVRREKNILSLKNLHENLKNYKKSIFTIPLVFQYNKMDLAEQGIPLLSFATMEKDLNSQLKKPAFEASAVVGTNVVATLKKIIMMTMTSIKDELK